MTDRHEELHEAVGAYVLGQLDGPLLRDVEAHVAQCARCRAEVADLAPLAAALRRVDPEAVAAATTAAAPSTLDARVEAALRAEEGRPEDLAPTADVVALPTRRRWVPALAGALVGAAAAAAVAVAVLPDPAPAGAPVIAVRDVTAADGVAAQAGLVDHTWGVELKLQVTGLPAGRAYDVRIVDDAGREYDGGAFLGVSGRTITCSMNASVLLADADRFDVVDPAGSVVVSGSIAS